MPIPKKTPHICKWQFLAVLILLEWKKGRNWERGWLTFENLVSPEQNVLHAAELELVKE